MQGPFLAQLADEVYKPPAERNVKDKILRNDERLLIIETPEKNVVVTIRGSKTADDFSIDAGLGIAGLSFFKKSPIYRDLSRDIEQTLSQVPDRSVIFTGHSLGGLLAHEIAKDFGTVSYTFNPASIPSLSAKDAIVSTERNRIIRHRQDPVSMFAKNATSLDLTGRNVHSISSFR